MLVKTLHQTEFLAHLNMLVMGCMEKWTSDSRDWLSFMRLGMRRGWRGWKGAWSEGMARGVTQEERTLYCLLSTVRYGAQV